LALAVLIGGRVLLGLSAAPDAARAIFNVAGLGDDGSERDSVNEVTLGATVADTVEVIVSAVADNTTRALESASLEDEVARDLIGGSVGVGRSDSEHFASWEGFVENVVGVAPSIVDVNVVCLSVIELGVDELASGALVAASGRVFGIEIRAELEVLDLGVGGIVQSRHGENVFMRDGVESDVIEGIDFSVSGGVAVGCVSSCVFLGIVVDVIVIVVVIVFVVVVLLTLLLSLITIVTVVSTLLLLAVSSLMMMIVVVIHHG
jgi:hypothetical protein